MTAPYERRERMLNILEIVRLLATCAQPMTTAEIAEELGVTKRTVQRHLAVIRDLSRIDLQIGWRKRDPVEIPVVKKSQVQFGRHATTKPVNRPPMPTYVIRGLGRRTTPSRVEGSV